MRRCSVSEINHVGTARDRINRPVRSSLRWPHPLMSRESSVRRDGQPMPNQAPPGVALGFR